MSPVPEEVAFDLIGNPTPGAVHVFVGPCSVMTFAGKRIPLDGRKFACDGQIFMRTSQQLRAKFHVDTTDFDFIDLESVLCFVKSRWYRWDEDELFEELGTTKEAALPFRWLPDRPLDYHEEGPYPMRFQAGAWVQL